ncbi:zinc finger MYM-type protein 6-like [Palaemon carinicauda]|uniref:zinc finger MYM-type protein 6-like n=1 Tax=Palaemon carinicauda TaxID=392227 RepID=UPI0035B60FC9
MIVGGESIKVKVSKSKIECGAMHTGIVGGRMETVWDYIRDEKLAKKMKPHTAGEEIIGPTCNIIVETMLGKEAQEQISKVPLSNNTISRRISEMSTDINEEVVKQIKSKRKFALQVDESTDIAEKCQLVGFCKFIDKDIVEQFMFCKELQTTTTGEDIFASVNSYLTQHGLSWNYCCSICTDGAPSMIGKYKGFITRALKENPSLITTHCFLHRGVSRETRLDCITLRTDMAEELDFTAIERDEFPDMSADSTLNVKFKKSDVTLAAFWHGTLGEYPNLAKKAISLLLPFSTSYLCEQAFSAMATIKSKQRNRLLSLEDDMRVALSTMRPDIKSLCAKHQSQVSH